MSHVLLCYALQALWIFFEFVHVGNRAPNQGRRQPSMHYSDFGSAENFDGSIRPGALKSLTLRDKDIYRLSEQLD